MKQETLQDYTNGFIPTKDNINRISDMFIDNVMEGKISVEQQVTLLRAINETVSNALEVLKPYLVDELTKYGKGDRCMVMGTTLELKEVGVKYDYTNCNDPVLTKLLEVKKDIDAQVKNRQEFLRKLTSMAFIPDTDTGELMEVHPPVKSSTTSYVINFPND